MDRLKTAALIALLVAGAWGADPLPSIGFPGWTKVRMDDGGTKAISDLDVDVDKTEEGGTVYRMAYENAADVFEYMELWYGLDTKLMVGKEQEVFKWIDEETYDVVRAGDLQSGDFLVHVREDGADDPVELGRVRTVMAVGAYAPHTYSGVMVAENVLVSCHATDDDKDGRGGYYWHRLQTLLESWTEPRPAEENSGDGLLGYVKK